MMKRLRISGEKNYEMLSCIFDYAIYFTNEISKSHSQCQCTAYL